ncbi:MAG TPA: energy transducer TonB [Lysobacter sp.]
MAHAHALPFPARAREPLDGSRIAAFAGTILLNAVLLLLLLIPLTEPLRHAAYAPDDVVIFEIPKPKEVPPPITDPLPVVQRRPVATSQPRPTPVAPPEVPLVDAQPGDIAIETTDVAVEPAASLEPVPPAAGAQLQALRSPPPTYPAEAVRAGLTGIVELEILVGIDGRPLDVRVVRSSGHRALDQAALRTVRTKWTFAPAMRDGQPVQALGRVPIAFTLD